MEQKGEKGLPVFDLEATFIPETNSVKVVANEYASSFLTELFMGLQQGVPGTHYPISQEVEAISGNVNELLLMKR
jgi:hypothetical protein